MRIGRAHLGVRATSTVSFAVLALVISAVLAGGTYLTARHFLLGQREDTAARQSFVDAALVREGLLTAGAEVSEVLDSTSPPPGAVVVIERDGAWYSSSLDTEAEAIPTHIRRLASKGQSAQAWTLLGTQPAIVVGVPIPAVRAQFYELSPTTELDSTLRTLAAVLGAFALVTTVAGALIGRAASARVVAPLEDVASATADIAAGRMTTRLPATSDPDLAVIVGSFNTMVEALDQRMRRDARFAADVAHELRSPVTTLMTSVTVLRGTEAGATGRRRAATDLVEREVRRLHRSLEHLLELGRLEAGVLELDRGPVDVGELVTHTVRDTMRPEELVTLVGSPLVVVANKAILHRAVVNLLDNADVHGGGTREVTVGCAADQVQVRVADAGPGVPTAERDRVFERFVRVGSRGSRSGSGLGLSLVAETAHAHGGSVWCEERPGGGATFVLSLPAAPASRGAGA
ncbi:HAMP domain-containing sensor histidine kinase [Knoellia aerolata]|uniref:histidine kinase n=1 Tax=Knoellia aerolata DSM 18566 TaxID=1385519 RepID=A0A0A0JZ98_9MICO|nr:HAMP domain-containing sensor histidine kinase [Knoellia aerolata]KGN42815.1 histidine kinase [Knoellia aerolata DSM 18566]